MYTGAVRLPNARTWLTLAVALLPVSCGELSSSSAYLHLTIYKMASIASPIFSFDVTFSQGSRVESKRIAEMKDAAIAIDPSTDVNFEFPTATGRVSMVLRALDEAGVEIGKASAEIDLQKGQTSFLSITLGETIRDMVVDTAMVVDASDAAPDLRPDLIDLSPPPPDFSGVDFAGTPNYAFVTSTAHNGDFGGLAGADSICNARALAAGLPGSYIAWLSTSTVDAKTRIAGRRGRVRTDGKPFVDLATALSSSVGAILYPLNVDEFGNTVSSSTVVVTGTNSSGLLDSNLACDDWTSASGINLATTGSVLGGSEAWNHVGGTQCNDATMHVYCFETDRTVSLSPPAGTGRVAFLSSGHFDTSTGLSGADQQCQTEAMNAGLAGTYKALLATQSASAASRMGAGATWKRTDGVQLGASANDFLDGTLWAPLNVTAAATYVGWNAYVRTGSTDARSTGIDTCVDWSTAASAAKSDIGIPADGLSWFRTPTSLTMVACNQFARIYCLQQ